MNIICIGLYTLPSSTVWWSPWADPPPLLGVAPEQIPPLLGEPPEQIPPPPLLGEAPEQIPPHS